jgi:hypothetical protein
MPARRKFDREHVASIVMEAIDLGLPLIQTVMEVLDASENQARHMVRMARLDGLLGAGAHKPARAMIHRGSEHEKTWIVCEACVTTWPCAQAFPYGTHDTIASQEPDDPPARPAGQRRRAARSRPRVDA